MVDKQGLHADLNAQGVLYFCLCTVCKTHPHTSNSDTETKVFIIVKIAIFVEMHAVHGCSTALNVLKKQFVFEPIEELTFRLK